MRRLKTCRKEKNHEHPGKTYQGAAGNASPDRRVAEHLAGLPQFGHLPQSLLRDQGSLTDGKTVQDDAREIRGTAQQQSDIAVQDGYNLPLMRTECAEFASLRFDALQKRYYDTSADVRTTLKVYAHFIPQSQRESMERIANRSIATKVPNGTRAVA